MEETAHRAVMLLAEIVRDSKNDDYTVECKDDESDSDFKKAKGATIVPQVGWITTRATDM
eukprot:3405453-Amphidinium_carterae.1